MRVRILNGNLAGSIVEQRQDEAENNIATGFAEPVTEAPSKPKGKTADRPKGAQNE